MVGIQPRCNIVDKIAANIDSENSKLAEKRRSRRNRSEETDHTERERKTSERVKERKTQLRLTRS